MTPSFDDITLRNIANVISDVLTHSKISEHFRVAGIREAPEGSNKTDRIYYSIQLKQKEDKCANNVLQLVRNVINPKRYDDEGEFERHRSLINSKLLFEGIEIDKYGQCRTVSKARTISEASERSKRIKERIHGIAVHHEILPFCEEEWLKENYFHAILEITKSVAEKLREKSSYQTDGSELVDDCFGLGKDKRPMLAFNTLQTMSDESEHKGFGNFIKGFFSMYRNPKAHTAKILEDTQLSDMTEVLVIASIIHRKLDKTYRTGINSHLRNISNSGIPSVGSISYTYVINDSKHGTFEHQDWR